MRRLAWTFAARIGDKYQIRLTQSNYNVTMYQHFKNAYTRFYNEFKLLLAFDIINAANDSYTIQ